MKWTAESDTLATVKRRQFLAQPAATAAAQTGTRPNLKITDIQVFPTSVGSRNLIFVKVLTDQGIYGIGEAYSCGPDEATVKVIEDYKTWLVGQDPRNIQYLWDLHPLSRRQRGEFSVERH